MFLNKQVLKKYDDLLHHPLRHGYEKVNNCDIDGLVREYKISYRQSIRAEWISVLIIPFTLICLTIISYVLNGISMHIRQGLVLLLVAVTVYLLMTIFASNFFKKTLTRPPAQDNSLLDGFRSCLPVLPWTATGAKPIFVRSESEFEVSLEYLSTRIVALEESIRSLCILPDKYIVRIVAEGTELINLRATFMKTEECARKFDLSFNRADIFAKAQKSLDLMPCSRNEKR